MFHYIDLCIVDDDAAQRALLRAKLLRENYSVAQAENGRDGLQQIRLQRPRVVICDLLMPEMDGIEMCRQVRADPTLDGIYIVLITALDSREHKTKALEAGADDYITKPYDLVELTARIRNGLRICRLQERLHDAARTDGLTGLWNHVQFRLQLDMEFSRTRRYGGVVSLLMIDLDHFKAVNDTYGHEFGNVILQATARHLKNLVREIDIVARYGGEEFAVILPQTDQADAIRLADRIRESLPSSLRIPEHPHLNLTASVGVSSNSDPNVRSVVDMINVADEALYVAKRAGRNRVIGGDALHNAGDMAGLQVQDVDELRKQVACLSMQAKELCLQSIWALVQALETRDSYTAWHSRNMRFYVERLGKAAGWTRSLRDTTANAAMLHDLGKIGVPDQILLKTSRLTEDEAAVVRQVPQITCKILEPLRVFETEILVIRHMRERFDGSGYPDGLIGGCIPLGSRMLAIVEAFAAMTSGRAYREGRPISEALRDIKAASGSQFDPNLVQILERTIQEQAPNWQAQVDLSRQVPDRGHMLHSTELVSLARVQAD